MADVIYSIVRSQGYMLNTPAEAITRHNQLMLASNDQGEALQPNGLLTHSYPTSFCIFK